MLSCYPTSGRRPYYLVPRVFAQQSAAAELWRSPLEILCLRKDSPGQHDHFPARQRVNNIAFNEEDERRSDDAVVHQTQPGLAP